MTPALKARKAALRAKVRSQIAVLSPAARASASVSVCRQLLESHAWQSATAVLLFAPLEDEPNIWPLVSAGLAAKKVVGLPAFDASTGIYLSRRVLDLNRDVVVGKFGIREPLNSCAELDLEEFDLILVPGVAFDRSGRRLGRGRGYYDQWLAKFPNARKLCGVAFAEQVVEQVPGDARDVTMGILLTPSRVSLANR